jgi:hypothetical protein
MLPPENKICPTITGYCPIIFLFLRILNGSFAFGDKNFVRKTSARSLKAGGHSC